MQPQDEWERRKRVASREAPKSMRQVREPRLTGIVVIEVEAAAVTA